MGGGKDLLSKSPHRSSPPKTPPNESAERTEDEAGASRGRTGKHKHGGGGLLMGVKRLLGTHTSGRRKHRSKECANKDGSCSTASSHSSSSRRSSDGGARSPKPQQHHGNKAHQIDSLEPVHLHKVEEKELKEMAKQTPKKQPDMPEAGVTAYTVFENDHLKNAQLAECKEEEAKLHMLGEMAPTPPMKIPAEYIEKEASTPTKKKREKRDSNNKSPGRNTAQSPGKSVESGRRNDSNKKRGRTKESPGIKSVGGRSPTRGKTQEGTGRKKKATTPRSGGAK